MKKRKTKANGPVYDSMAQCAGTTGVSVEQLKEWKASGAPGFTLGGRVNWSELDEWLTEKQIPEQEFAAKMENLALEKFCVRMFLEERPKLFPKMRQTLQKADRMVMQCYREHVVNEQATDDNGDPIPGVPRFQPRSKR